MQSNNMTESNRKIIPASSQQVFIAYPASSDEEVDLLDVWRTFWEHRMLVAGIFLACTLMAATVALILLPRVYQSETILRPPGYRDAQMFRVPDMYEITPEELYARFLTNLRSVGIRHRFFQDNNLMEELQQEGSGGGAEYGIFKLLRKIISVEQINSRQKSGTEFVKVTMEGRFPDKISQWLNGYIHFVDHYTIQGVINGIQARLAIEADSIKNKIKALRNTAKMKRLDRIKRLQEAVSVAKNLGIKDVTDLPFALSGQGGDNITNVVKGYKALQIELELLQKREDDDPFIPGLRELQVRLDSLEKEYIVPEDVHSVTIDKKAIPPEHPFKPKRLLIVVLGGVMGLILGIVASFVKKMRQAL